MANVDPFEMAEEARECEPLVELVIDSTERLNEADAIKVLRALWLNIDESSEQERFNTKTDGFMKPTLLGNLEKTLASLASR